MPSSNAMLAARTKPLTHMVCDVMAKPNDRQWTMHGLGMLTADFDAARRYQIQLHSRQFMTPGISMVRSRSRGVTSHVIAGQFTNVSYRRGSGAANFMAHGESEALHLEMSRSKNYEAGDAYRDDADEIHASYFADGTVTLCERTADDDAKVFWKISDGFVTAKSRRATKAEVRAGASHALAAWF